MADEPENVLKRLVSQGWMANIVVAVIFAAISQASLLGIILGLVAMIVLLITTARFRSMLALATTQQAPLYRSAIRIGVSFATICIAASLYISYRPVILNEIPKHALEAVVSEATSKQADAASIQLIPEFRHGERGNSIFGFRRSEFYQILPARPLVDQLFKDALSRIDYIVQFCVGILCLWFIAALILGWYSEQLSRHNATDEGG